METRAISPTVESSARASSSVRTAVPITPEPRWIRGLAATLSTRDIHPQTLVFVAHCAAIFAALLLPIGGLVESGLGTMALAISAICIPLRTICELVADRMYGPAPARRPELYAGVPELLADALLVVAAGYAASTMAIGPMLGFSAAVLGLLLAHVRTLSGTRRVVPTWTELASPTARMAALAATCIIAAIVPYGWRQVPFLLILTGLGSICSAAIWIRVRRT
jgi:hypothetical protein